MLGSSSGNAASRSPDRCRDGRRPLAQRACSGTPTAIASAAAADGSLRDLNAPSDADLLVRGRASTRPALAVRCPVRSVTRRSPGGVPQGCAGLNSGSWTSRATRFPTGAHSSRSCSPGSGRSWPKTRSGTLSPCVRSRHAPGGAETGHAGNDPGRGAAGGVEPGRGTVFLDAGRRPSVWLTPPAGDRSHRPGCQRRGARAILPPPDLPGLQCPPRPERVRRGTHREGDPPEKGMDMRWRRSEAARGAGRHATSLSPAGA